jgi:PAS domain S-box-containing protein
MIEYVNPAYEKLTGYQRSELIGNSIDALRDYFFYPEFESKILEMKAMVASGIYVYSGTFKRKRKSGEIIDVILSISTVHDEARNIMNYVAVVRDITEEARLQQQLLQSQKQESIGTLAGGIAHDLKNTFTPILLNTEMLMEDMGAESPEYPLLDEISKATRHGVDLVNQILTFSRRTPQRKKAVAISPVIRETLDLLRSTLPSTIEVRSHIQVENAFVYAEPVQIRQLLINLGSNAGYAMRDQGGFLDIGLSSVILDKESALVISPNISAGPYVRITVSDTGKGMDEETRKRIFDPFFTTKKPGEGTGMGLSVVQGIVKSHQGAITVQSEPGKGAIFTILLPMLTDKITEK